MSSFRTYVRVFALEQCLQSGVFHSLSAAFATGGFQLASIHHAGLAVVPLALWGAIRPSLSSALLSHAAAILLHLYKAPWMWEYEYISLLAELAVLVNVSIALYESYCAGASHDRSGTHEQHQAAGGAPQQHQAAGGAPQQHQAVARSEEDPETDVYLELVMDRSAPLVRMVMTLALYLAAGWWKINDNFLSLEHSCAPVLIAQLIVRIVPDGLLVGHNLMQLLLQVQPVFACILECCIGPILAVAPQLGVLLAVTFHALIAVTPPPNNAAGFSVAAATSLVFFHHHQLAAAANKAFVFGTTHNMLVSLAAAVGLALALPGSDWALSVYAPLATLHIIALFSPSQAPTNANNPHSRKPSPIIFAVFTVLAIGYAFVLPILGVQDMGNQGQYANLHIGPSATNPLGNHLVVPTGLLLIWGVAPYDGGIIRVTSTNSQYVINHYAAVEVTGYLDLMVVKHLQASGHSGRQYMPYLTRVIGASAIDTDKHFVPFEVPAFELRRIMEDAMELDGESFWMTYERVSIDQTSAINAVHTSTMVRVASNRNITCTTGDCGPDAPHLRGPLPWFARKFSAFRPRLVGASGCLD